MNSVQRPAVFDRLQHFWLYLALFLNCHQTAVQLCGFTLR